MPGREIDLPVADEQDDVGVIGLSNVAIDDDNALQAAAKLFRGVAVGMKEEGAGVGRHEIIVEFLAGQDRLLHEIGHAVLIVRKAANHANGSTYIHPPEVAGFPASR